MYSWNELVKMALLGTEKAPKPDAVLPEAIRLKLVGADSSDREGYFYKAAALSLVYEKAGRSAEKMTLLTPPVAPEEIKTICPASWLAMLRKLMTEGNRRTDLLGLFFDKMARQSFVLPPDDLVPVLQLGIQPVYKVLQPEIRKIAGSRGAWMTQFNPAWQYLETKEADTIWREGTPAERRQYLSALQQSDPQKAFELLRQSWETDSGRERKEWLRVLQHHPGQNALDFVEEIFESLAVPKENAKQINVEIKKLAVEILLLNPASGLFRNVVAALKKYGSTRKKMLGLQSKKNFTIPENEDDFFCEKEMADRLGFERSSPLPGISTPAFWFCELMRCLHPIAWEQIIGEQWEDIFQAFAAAEMVGKKHKLPLIQHLSHALARSKYRNGILAYLKQFPADDSNYFMLDALSQAELEAYTTRQLNGLMPLFLRESLQRSGWVWSKPLSRAVFKNLVEENPDGFHYQEFTKILNLGIHFDLAMIDELYKKAQQETRDWNQQVLRSQLIIPLLRILELRKEIEFLPSQT